MTAESLRQTLLTIVRMYFGSANVIWGWGNYTKLSKPLVMLSLRTCVKSTHPIVKVKEGVAYNSYPSTAKLDVNLITRGKEETTPQNFTAVYDNTAASDLEEFCLFVESAKVSYICDENNITILQDGNVTDVTALIDGIEQEYRAMVSFTIDYMNEVSGNYNLNDKPEPFKPTASGGRTDEIVNSDIGYFVKVDEIESEDFKNEK